MATVSTAIPAGTTRRRTRDKRLIVFRGVAGLLSVGLLFGAMVVLFLLAPWTLVGPEEDGYVAELHRWHHADTGALLGILVVGSLAALIPDPRRRLALAQAVLVGLGAMAATSLVEMSPEAGAASLIVGAVIAAAYPAPRALMSLRREGPVILPLLALAATAAVPLLVNAWDNVRLQAEDHGPHAAEHHWSGSAAVATALALTGFLVAVRRPGWRALGVILGATYVYLGVAALTIPDHDGSWGVRGGLFALLAGAGFIVGTFLEGRRVSRSSR